MQWVLLPFVMAFFGVIEFWLIRDRIRLAPVRSAVRKEVARIQKRTIFRRLDEVLGMPAA
jgi:hypothetical protein